MASKYRIIGHCKCGATNYTLEDWCAHWKYGIVRQHLFLGKYPKLRAVYLILTAKLSITKVYFSGDME